MTKTELNRLLSRVNPSEFHAVEVNLYQSTIENEAKRFLGSASALAKSKKSPHLILIAVSKV